VLPLDEVVGPVTVLVAEVAVVVIVPLLDTVAPPLGLRVEVENEELGVEVVVLVVHEVVVVPVEVTVVVVAAPEPELDVVEAEEVVVELAAVLEEVGVQPGRVNVPLYAPELPSTMQFLEQAASPLVSEVCQQGA
jgi:hypothetical protein